MLSVETRLHYIKIIMTGRLPGRPFCENCNSEMYQIRPSKPMGHGRSQYFANHLTLPPGKCWIFECTTFLLRPKQKDLCSLLVLFLSLEGDVCCDQVNMVGKYGCCSLQFFLDVFLAANGEDAAQQFLMSICLFCTKV